MTGAPTSRRDIAPKLTARDKLIVALRHFGLTIAEVQYDHCPALAFRKWVEADQDFDPPARSLEHVTLLMVDGPHGHKVKTFGPGGERRTTTAGGDLHALAHTRRLTKKQEEFCRSVTNKKPGRPRKKQSAIPSRPFQKRRKAR